MLLQPRYIRVAQRRITMQKDANEPHRNKEGGITRGFVLRASCPFYPTSQWVAASKT